MPHLSRPVVKEAVTEQTQVKEQAQAQVQEQSKFPAMIATSSKIGGRRRKSESGAPRSRGRLLLFSPILITMAGTGRTLGSLPKACRAHFHNRLSKQLAASSGRGPGPAGGAAVDLITLAARQSNILLQWIYGPGGPEEALSTKGVDLWPLLVKSAGAPRHIPRYRPRAKITYGIIALPSVPIGRPRDVMGRTLAGSIQIAADARVVQQFFPMPLSFRNSIPPP